MIHSFFSSLGDAVVLLASQGLNQFCAQLGVVVGAIYGYDNRLRVHRLVKISAMLVFPVVVTLLSLALWPSTISFLVLTAPLIWICSFGFAGFSLGWTLGAIGGFCVGRMKRGTSS
jgi:hypothetical protein